MDNRATKGVTIAADGDRCPWTPVDDTPQLKNKIRKQGLSTKFPDTEEVRGSSPRNRPTPIRQSVQAQP
jgi:hypothetical protein